MSSNSPPTRQVTLDFSGLLKKLLDLEGTEHTYVETIKPLGGLLFSSQVFSLGDEQDTVFVTHNIDSTDEVMDARGFARRFPQGVLMIEQVQTAEVC